MTSGLEKFIDTTDMEDFIREQIYTANFQYEGDDIDKFTKDKFSRGKVELHQSSEDYDSIKYE